jgi:RimJ/RimL family protein N-acetyltransferase
MIYGKRIRLRAPEREDIPRFVQWLNDPEVRRGLLFYMPMSLGEEENWFDSMLARPPAEHPMVIEIRQEDYWLAIGNCGVHQIDWRCRSAIVGIFIGEKQFWNQGYGSETMELLLEHAFNTLNLNRISLDVYENNLGAIRAYEKAGFVLEGRKRQAMYQDGEYLDILQMSVLRDEWKR